MVRGLPFTGPGYPGPSLPGRPSQATQSFRCLQSCQCLQSFQCLRSFHGWRSPTKRRLAWRSVTGSCYRTDSSKRSGFGQGAFPDQCETLSHDHPTRSIREFLLTGSRFMSKSLCQRIQRLANRDARRIVVPHEPPTSKRSHAVKRPRPVRGRWLAPILRAPNGTGGLPETRGNPIVYHLFRVLRGGIEPTTEEFTRTWADIRVAVGRSRPILIGQTLDFIGLVR